MIDYLLAGIIIYLGLPAGYAIGLLAPEEIKPGKKYLVHLSIGLLAITSILIIASNLWVALPLIAAMAAIALSRRTTMYFNALPAFLYVAYVGNGFESAASLSLLSSLPIGTLANEKNLKRSLLELAKRHWPFLAMLLLAILAGSFFK